MLTENITDAPAHLTAPTATKPGTHAGGEVDGKDVVRTGEGKSFRTHVEELLTQSESALANNEFASYRRRLRELLFRILARKPDYLPDTTDWLKSVSEDGSNLRIFADWLRDYVGEQVTLDRQVEINWPSNDVAKAFLAFPRSESVTVDPHKMGYAPYPAGCVAFRNDLVRSFVLQEAPYITSAERDYAVHVPPRYSKKEGTTRRVVTESFSPFILEGSRPGATAAGLWLAMKCVPYNPRGHGAIVRSSLISAKLLHVMLVRYGLNRSASPECPIALLKRQERRGTEPSIITKMAIGCFLVAISYFVLAGVQFIAGPAGKVHWLWCVVYFAIITTGELFFSPVGLSLYFKAAPAQIAAFMMAVFLAASFPGNLLAGWLGTYFSVMDEVRFFLLIAVIAGMAAPIIWAFDIPMRRLMKRQAADRGTPGALLPGTSAERLKPMQGPKNKMTVNDYCKISSCIGQPDQRFHV